MTIEKINFSYPAGTLQSVYDTQEMTALELASKTSKKVDECVELVNGVEQSAIEATAVVDEMKQEQNTLVQNLSETIIPTATETYIDEKIADGTISNLINVNIFNELNTDIDNLQTTTTTQSTSIDGLDTRLETAESDINNLQTTTTSHSTSINGLDTRLEVAESDINNLQTTTTSQSTSISGIDTRLEVAESKIETLQTKDNNIVNVKNFGAVGDGVADDTLALKNGLQYAINNKKYLYIPSGVYSVDTVTYNPLEYANQINIIGESQNTVLLKKRTIDAQPLFIVGHVDKTIFIGEIKIENISFEGIEGNTPAIFRCYDLVRSTISSCLFRKGVVGVESFGGISNRFINCIFEYNQIGVKHNSFVSKAGGGYPNLIVFEKCVATHNTKWGMWFDNGRMFTCNDCDIEGNGTTGDSTTGAIYVGANIGSEGNTPQSTALRLNSCWFEVNSGKAHIVLESGKNYITGCYFCSSINTTHAIYIKGGNYFIKDCHSDDPKQQNIKEDINVLKGNTIIDSTFGGYDLDELSGFVYDPLKTMIVYKEGIKHKGGSMVTVKNKSLAFMQTGTDWTPNVELSIAFPQLFKEGTTPEVIVSVSHNDVTKLQCVEVFNVTNAGFNVRKKSIIAGASTINLDPNIGITWIAVGTL